MKFEINENAEISLEVEITNGSLNFVPVSLDNDWASYSLETETGDLIAEHVSYEAMEVHDERLLVEWYKTTYPDECAFCDQEDIPDAAEEKLYDVFGSPDTLYEAHIITARKSALKTWLDQETPKVYRNDLRGFGNEFDLIYVMDGAEYAPGENEYELSAEDALKYHFMYANDPTTGDYSSATVVEAR